MKEELGIMSNKKVGQHHPREGYHQKMETSIGQSSIRQHYSPGRKIREPPMEDSPGEGVFLEKVASPPKKKLRMIKVP